VKSCHASVSSNMPLYAVQVRKFVRSSVLGSCNGRLPCGFPPAGVGWAACFRFRFWERECSSPQWPNRVPRPKKPTNPKDNNWIHKFCFEKCRGMGPQ
jgi:hypothetical protein